MYSVKIITTTVILITLCLQEASAAEITGADFEDCSVLLGTKKVNDFTEVMNNFKHEADAGSEKDGLTYAEILSNRFVCYEHNF